MRAPRLHLWMALLPALTVTAATAEAWYLSCRAGSYDWRAYFSSLGDLLLRVLSGLLPLGLANGLLQWVWIHRAWTLTLQQPWTWPLLVLGEEFLYYWMHRADHRVRWLWATHSVHHSPQALNLSAAYRLGWTVRLSLGPVFFAPLVLIGFPPAVVVGALAANLFYQFWLHTTWIPRLGWLETVLNTPAHHRIHHASNPEYLDANFGGVLLVFDRLFGTLAVERPGVEIRYGLVHALATYNPIRIGLHEWRAIARDLFAARSVRSALNAALGPPR